MKKGRALERAPCVNRGEAARVLVTAILVRRGQPPPRQVIARVESMWYPSLPGIRPWDIAENYAEYLGFRAVEQWAKSQCAPP
jgi:hypothetical protein